MTEAAGCLTSNCARTWTHHAAVPEQDARMRSAEPYRKRPARPSGPAPSRPGGSGGDSRRSCSRAGSAAGSPAASGRRPQTLPRQPTLLRPPSRSEQVGVGFLEQASCGSVPCGLEFVVVNERRNEATAWQHARSRFIPIPTRVKFN